VPSAAITVSGIPIDPAFAEPKDVRAMRAKHGLAPDQTTILGSTGGFGWAPSRAWCTPSSSSSTRFSSW